MMNEAEFYRTHLRPQLEQWGDHSRVENSTESGFPDISYGIHGRNGFIETKIIRSGKLHFETFQIAWLRRRARAVYGRDLWVLATDGNGLFLYTAYAIINAPRKKERDWLVIKTEELEAIVEGLEKPWPWGKVLTTLTYLNDIQDSFTTS